ncbi:MAG TPA: phage capsid protein [Arenicellales bacterium]|nr:phage capsid protein [Arenicellales bacterium]
MSFEVDTAFVNQYRSNVMFLAQQKGSRLRGSVMVENDVTGENYFWDQIGRVAARKVTQRHGDSPLNSTPHDRRRVSLFDYDTGDLIDQLDKVKMLIDPSSAYAQAHAWAMGRGMDDEIIDAFFGTAYEGKDGSTSVSFPAAQQVAVDNHDYDSGSGNTGLTISKLLAAKEILDSADLDPDEPRYIAPTARQISDLLSTTEVSSADYNTVKALAEGRIDSYMGFQFIRTQRIGTDSNSYRRVPVWTQSGLGLAVGKDITARVTERSDKRFSMYAYFSMSIGATRLEEDKVVEIKCDES